ncbi:protease complex subunit PrcB family protein [Xanthovirga aplysinae]|uniref:protease complex subunit PrcB family protein n=1 Tax=Xanthovirga aplysinae TaxID=2529853 RepID=UPI0012BC3E14|nr:protease complex subunit PrcB family protein [Xanthovirga aplysinae]MTI30754.1 protease complex subunit PrcB family protein [Xanthovirga aplysinae]
MKRILCLIVFTFLLSACDEKETEEYQEVPFEIIDSNVSANESRQSYEVINSQESFDDMINKQIGNGFLTDPIIDFETETVIAVFMGEMNSGGHSINIENIKLFDSGSLKIKVKKIYPGEGDIVTWALTNPYQIVKIQGSFLVEEVIFID